MDQRSPQGCPAAQERAMKGARRALDGLDDDIRDHIERETQDNIDGGLAPDEARRQAMLSSGNVALAKEDTRVVWVSRRIDELQQDIRYAVRTLRRSPRFAAVAILTLALGIGANAAIFSVVHAVLLRSLPYPGADRFVRIATQFQPNDGSGIKTSFASMSFEDLEFFRSRSRTLSNLGTYVSEAVTLSGRGEVVHLNGVRISPQVMAMLEATPLMGRLLEPREEAAGLDRVTVISFAMWQRRFSGDDAILGMTIVLDGIQYEVVGVMRPGFQFPNADAEFWTPFVWQGIRDEARSWLESVGATVHGVNLRKADAA
jgi:hypothetical protein